MAWERAEEIFPTQFISTSNGVLTKDDLRNHNIPMIQMGSEKYARNMLTETKIYTWGADGESAINIAYDLLNSRPHVTSESPTNVFGMAMLYNFYNLNNIQFNPEFGMHGVGHPSWGTDCNCK